ncbi:MAG TPA: ABC transporter permease [Bryobacteraceae bacterium]|nr:ABC transporter permease [Bryobacteraceae bacterium]
MLKSLRHALRLLLKSPGFTLVSVCSLAIGIGATSAMFSFADALILRPLPVLEPSGIAAISTSSSAAFANTALSYPDYRDYRDGNRSFDGLLASSVTSFGFKPNASALPKVTYGMYVSGNFFRVLGVQPALGRGFLESEDQAVGRDGVVVLGHDYWVSQFNSSPSAVGSTIWINGVPLTVIGVMPQQFTGIDQFVKPSMFVPIAMFPRLSGADGLEKRDVRWLAVKGRLKPGVSIAQAAADMTGIGTRLEQMYPKSNRNQRVDVETEFQMRVKQSPPNAALVAMLLMLAICVLLVACANVTGLLLSRARARSREMAVRLAIGAARGALIRQLLLENLLLAMAGGLGGIAVAYLGTSFFNSIPIPTDVPLAFHVSVDQRMLLFTIAASLISTFLFGLTPALQTTRLDLVSSLKAADADSSGRRRLWGRNSIVSGQVALSLILLIVSAVLLQGFHDELQQGPGFRTDHLWLTGFDTTPVHYSEDQSRRFYKDLLDHTRRAPGVRSAALVAGVPLLGGGSTPVVPEGYTLPNGEQSISLPSNYVSDGYFAAMDIPIVRGRAFLDSDRAETPLVAVVNEHFANHFWPKQDALGKRFHLRTATGPLVQIVGIAKMAKYFWIAEPPLDFIYLPYTQEKNPAMTIVAQTDAPDASTLAPVLREVVRGIDPNMPVFDARTMQDFYRQRAVRTPDIIAESVAGLGTMGLILAMVGLYGLISYSVSRRRREIGIRMAIGADRRKVIRMILGQGLVLGSIGVAIGLIVSFFVCRAVMTVAWVASFDHMNYGLFPAIAIPLLAITLLATFGPARRASLVDPMRALRDE